MAAKEGCYAGIIDKSFSHKLSLSLVIYLGGISKLEYLNFYSNAKLMNLRNVCNLPLSPLSTCDANSTLFTSYSFRDAVLIGSQKKRPNYLLF